MADSHIPALAYLDQTIDSLANSARRATRNAQQSLLLVSLARNLADKLNDAILHDTSASAGAWALPHWTSIWSVLSILEE